MTSISLLRQLLPFLARLCEGAKQSMLRAHNTRTTRMLPLDLHYLFAVHESLPVPPAGVRLSPDAFFMAETAGFRCG